VALFEAPNPLLSSSKFLKTLTQQWALWGESYLILLKETRVERPGSQGSQVVMKPVERVGGGEGMLAEVEEPDEVWPVAGHLVEEVVDKEKGPLPYKYRVHTGNGVEEFPAHAVVQIADANPHSVLRGVGPMTAALRDTAKAYQVDRYDEALLSNGGTPGGTLSVEGRLSDTELRAVRGAWREAHERPDSHRKTAILPNGTKYTPHGFTPHEMEFSGFREWLRQTIMATFGVTKPILGITDDVNMSNAREAYRVFWETTITPLVRFFEDELNFKLYRRVRGWREFSWSLNLDGVAALREDIDAKVERTIKLYKDGHRTFAEAAMLAGWDLGEQQLQGADERWIQTNLLPPDLAAEGPPEPPAPAEGDDDEPDADEPDDDDEQDAEPADTEDDDDEDRSVRDAEPDEERDALLDRYWRSHDGYLRGREARFQRAVFGQFRAFFRTVEQRLEKVAEQARTAPDTTQRYVVTEAELERLLDYNLETWNEAMAAAVDPEWVSTMVTSAERLQFEIGGGGTLLAGTDPVVLDFLRTKHVQIAEGWTSSLAKSLQKKMVATLATAPANVSSLAKAIAEVLDELKDDVSTMVGQSGRRAMMIARTEVTAASSFARTQQMQEDGIDEHTWLSSRDAQVREHHVDLDGRTVTVGQPFGYSLRYPGDNFGAAKDVIQCRCTTIPELPERAVPNIWDFTPTT